MTDLPILNGLDETPVFTIKTVVQETGIAPATLRAWERRYGCLSPGRSDGGYRLYSQRDIAIVRWLKRQVDTGVSISSAVALLSMRGCGSEPVQGGVPETPPATDAVQLPAQVDALVGALLAFHEPRAESILSEVFAVHPLEVALEAIVAPALAEIGERWRRGEATIVQEHFATAFLRRRLSALLYAYEQPQTGPLAITGTAPSEWHDVGILLVSLVLRRRGWRVIYLSQNVPADHLVQEIRKLQPDMVCLSAATLASAEMLRPFCAAVQRLPAPRPRIVLGGHAFAAQPELRGQFSGCDIVATARELVERLPRG